MGVVPGTLVAGRFRVLSELGRGGMATVYVAEDREHPGPPLALKLVPPSREEDDVSLRRFRREAETLGKLQHPHILGVLDSGTTDEGGLWLSMPRLEGEDLDRRLRRGPLPIDQAIRAAHEVALALAHAHERGIVHRDLKPSNVFLEARPSGSVVRVLDFGIARVFNDPALTRITSTGRTLGSPGYMSPEQILGVELDGRSDLYALGVLLFQMLVGRPPLPVSGDMFSVLRAHLDQTPPRLSAAAPEREFPAALEVLVASLLEKEPRKRPPDAGSVVSALAPFERADPEPPSMPKPAVPVSRGPSALTLVVTAALGGMVVLAAVAFMRRPEVLARSTSVATPPTTPALAVLAEPPEVIAEPEPEPVIEPAPAPAPAPAPEARPTPPRRVRRSEAARPAPSPEPTPAATIARLPLPNDKPLRDNITRLREGPSADDRTNARANLLALFRQTIAALPPSAQPNLSRELAGLAAAGSADAFARFHRRVRSAWEGSAQ